MLLYQLSTKKLPFQGDDPMKVYYSILENRVDYTLVTEQPKRTLIKKLLHFELPKRFLEAHQVLNHPYYADISW